ncbi:MAG: NAD(P)(+) transhydrogenase (Re/Si-specific) subunit beta, partial [Gemmatimonadetes bacterium]|nr:NAD(P)(+) transhydrogenase (Re/Si-specific) subunit beta [Gemmatimonadota bacterium]
MIPAAVERLIYLVAAGIFITGLKQLQNPATARQGNRLSAVGMLIAIVVTVLQIELLSPTVMFAGLIVGSAVGWWMARAVQMTSMPQMVALLNG